MFINLIYTVSTILQAYLTIFYIFYFIFMFLEIKLLFSKFYLIKVVYNSVYVVYVLSLYIFRIGEFPNENKRVDFSI